MSGVFSSWLTERRKFRSASCACWSCAASSLNATASVAISAAPSTGTGSGCVPRARRARGRRDPVDRPRDAAREEERGERGEQPSGGRRDEEPPDVRRQERVAVLCGRRRMSVPGLSRLRGEVVGLPLRSASLAAGRDAAASSLLRRRRQIAGARSDSSRAALLKYGCSFGARPRAVEAPWLARDQVDLVREVLQRRASRPRAA